LASRGAAEFQALGALAKNSKSRVGQRYSGNRFSDEEIIKFATSKRIFFGLKKMSILNAGPTVAAKAARLSRNRIRHDGKKHLSKGRAVPR
jgi:hypothetical protein